MYALNKGRNIAINKLTSSVDTLVQLLNVLSAPTAANIVDELSPTVVAKVFSNPNLQNPLAIIDSWFRSSLSNYDSIAAALANAPVSASSIASLLSQYLSSGIVSPSRIASVFASYQLPVANIYNILTGLSGDQAQKILYAWAGSLLSIDQLIDLLTYKAASVKLGANTKYTGINIFNVLNLGGYTYSADGQPHVIIADQITGSGAITKTPTGGAGGTSANAGTGGAGGGGLIIIAKTIGGLIGSISISADGVNGNNPSIIDGTDAQGGAGGAGTYLVVGTDVAGAGGAGGNAGTNSAGGSGGGNGGASGSGGLGDGAPGGSASYIKYSSYSSLASTLLYAAIDYFISNVLGKTLSTATSFPSAYGAGGGGSFTLSTNGSGGSGGGAGGQIIILAVNVSASSITAKGGNGSPAAQGSTTDNAGGGGGGGGIIYVMYRNYYFINSYSVAGGAGGAGGTSSQNGKPGTNGTMKVVAI